MPGWSFFLAVQRYFQNAIEEILESDGRAKEQPQLHFTLPTSVGSKAGPGPPIFLATGEASNPLEAKTERPNVAPFPLLSTPDNAPREELDKILSLLYDR